MSAPTLDVRDGRWVAKCFDLCMGGARKATAYIEPDKVVKVTRRFAPGKENLNVTLHLTWGRPNYAERKFIKACVKAGERFPVRKIQVREFVS